jgi:hypothetical protein
LFERALQIDPTDVDALNGIAVTYLLDFVNGWGDPGTDYDAKTVLSCKDRFAKWRASGTDLQSLRLVSLVTRMVANLPVSIWTDETTTIRQWRILRAIHRFGTPEL